MNLERLPLGAPLYWRSNGNSSALSREDLACLLGRGTPRRAKTLISGISNVPPGYLLSFTSSREHILTRITSIFDGLSDELDVIQPRHIRTALIAEISRIRAMQQPIGLMLSGGLDSTILAILLKKLGIEFEAFISQFNGLKESKDAVFAQYVATYLGITLTHVDVSEDDLWHGSELVISTLGRPSMCWVVANQLAIAREASLRGIHLLMSGIGSDEAFIGYGKLGRYALRFDQYITLNGEAEAWRTILGPKTRARNSLLYLGECCPFSRRMIARMFPGLSVGRVLEEDIVSAMFDLKQKYPKASYSGLMLQLEIDLRMSDVIAAELSCISEQYGVSLVFPFLSSKVLNLAANTPAAYKCIDRNVPELRARPRTKCIDKLILRLAFQDDVPTRIQIRPRQSYTFPFEALLKREEMKGLITRAILTSSIWSLTDTNLHVIEDTLATDYLGNQWGNPFRIWVLYQIVRWWERDGPAILLEKSR